VIAAAGISDGVLAMTGNTPVKLINSVVQTILSIGLCILLIPKWGALGAALAVLISFTVIHVILVIEVYMLFRMLPYTLGFFKPLVAGLIALPIGWFISHFFLSGTNFFLAIVNGLIIMVIYIGVILLLGLSPEDRSVLNHLTKRITATFSKK
jgi:O-antigen/teichoic acid export membrane protein